MTDKKIPYFLALAPILFLIILLSINVVMYEDPIGGANQLALLLSGALAAVIGLYYGSKWKEIMEGIANSIKSVVPAIIMLLLIGSLAGTWLISGVIPTMIYYGLQILNPTIFLFATAIITAIVSLATGSSWSTIATVGIALLGIGTAIGLPLGLIGGAIISGAYFGDKMSPLSETTNMAAAISGVDLFDHIKYMMYTTVPSFIIIGNLQTQIDAGFTPSIAWQVLAYAILTASEVFISITCLEFSYTQAPNTMKSLIMGFFMLSVSLGNIFTAMVNAFIQNPDGSSKLVGASYFYFFAGTMMVTSILFLIVLKHYKPKTYLHAESK